MVLLKVKVKGVNCLARMHIHVGGFLPSDLRKRRKTTIDLRKRRKITEVKPTASQRRKTTIVEEVSKAVRSLATNLKKETANKSVVPINYDTDHGIPTKDTSKPGSKWLSAVKRLSADRRLRAVNHNIETLRSNLVQYVKRNKALGREDFLLIFSYAVYSSFCDRCFMYFDCSLYEDGETYLVADVSIKCKGLDAEAYAASTSYVAFMSVLFPLGIPLYYLWSLYRMRNFIDPELSCILKDSDYATAFALSGVYTYTDKDGTTWTKKPKKAEAHQHKAEEHKVSRRTSIFETLFFKKGSADSWIMRFENEGNEMSAEQLSSMKDALSKEWTQKNSALAKSLEGKDYKFEFEQQQRQLGFQKAKQVIKRKARAASIPVSFGSKCSKCSQCSQCFLNPYIAWLTFV
jgi:hypothetical protein